MDWTIKPATILSVIVMIFTIGVAWTTINFKVVALEAAIQRHEKTPDRLLKLEIDMGYVRSDIGEIKDIVKDNAKQLQKHFTYRKKQLENK